MRLTNNDRKIVREWLELYKRAPLYPLTAKSLRRTQLWANGRTMTEIAELEKVGLGRVSQSVRTLANRIIEFAEGISK
jgi:DNA-binding CsgD family transcriptional regulator